MRKGETKNRRIIMEFKSMIKTYMSKLIVCIFSLSLMLFANGASCFMIYEPDAPEDLNKFSFIK